MKVFTSKGLLDRNQLTVKDVIVEDEASSTRTVATEWYQGDEMVKRSVWVDRLAPLEIGT